MGLPYMSSALDVEYANMFPANQRYKMRVVFHYRGGCRPCNEFRPVWNETVRQLGGEIEFCALASSVIYSDYPEPLKASCKTVPFIFIIQADPRSTGYACMLVPPDATYRATLRNELVRHIASPMDEWRWLPATPTPSEASVLH